MEWKQKNSFLQSINGHTMETLWLSFWLQMIILFCFFSFHIVSFETYSNFKEKKKFLILSPRDNFQCLCYHFHLSIYLSEIDRFKGKRDPWDYFSFLLLILFDFFFQHTRTSQFFPLVFNERNNYDSIFHGSQIKG